MPATSGTDNILAGILGALEGFQSAYQPYQQNRMNMNLYQQKLNLERQNQIQTMQQALPIQSQYATQTAGAEAAAKLPSEIALEQSKNKIMGSQLNPKMQAAFGLDPNNPDDMNRPIDERTIMPMMHYLAIKESMGQRQQMGMISGAQLKLIRPDLASQIDDNTMYPNSYAAALSAQGNAAARNQVLEDIQNKNRGVMARIGNVFTGNLSNTATLPISQTSALQSPPPGGVPSGGLTQAQLLKIRQLKGVR